MLGLLPQPKMQAAEATIITLCDRLAHSTMLEDRRAAILSLKGFAHDKRELVASNGIKGLINSLKQDKNDPETIRACLETLIILFIKASSIDSDLLELSRRARQKNKRYVSPLISSRKAQNEVFTGPVDDISLWLTDEFTHDNGNVVALLDFAQSKDMFTSLYAMQLLSAMVASRPDTIKQSLFSVPQGISTLVAAMESKYEMVRDEAVLLLLHLTDNHLEFQKLVAFEGAFDKLFTIIDDEGDICFGGVTVENCLSLFSNLLQYNVSNQKLFSATQGIVKYASMIDTGDEANWGEQATSNMTLALQLARLFVVPGGEATRMHQDSFAQAGVLLTVLKLAFGPATSLPIRTASLLTASSLVYENQARQEELLGIDVPYYDLSLSLNVQMTPNIVPVSQALLNWALLLPSHYLFTLRAASQFCLTAAFEGNEDAARRFVDEQVAGLKKAEEDSSRANIFTTLAEYNEDWALNPFKVWFASVILMRIFSVSNDLKDYIRQITIGDAELGQDELPIIQAVSGQLLTSLDHEDPTISLAYLMLLCTWLFDDIQAVNDFVAERSVVQQLVTYVTTNNGGSGHVLVGSLATILLGIAYDFCSSTSPITRVDFYHLLTNTLGRDQYTLSFQRFRENPEFKDFDPSLIFSAAKGPNGLPKVYFESLFITLVRDNINRIQRAIDRDPTVEPSSRISLEMYEELKLQLIAKEKEFKEQEYERSQKEEALVASETQLKAELERTSEALKTLEESHSTISGDFESLQSTQGAFQAELSSLKSDHEKLSAEHKEKLEALSSTRQKLAEIEAKHAKTSQQIAQLTTAKEKAEDGINKVTRELFLLNKEGAGDVKKLRDQLANQTSQLEVATKKLNETTNALTIEKKNNFNLQSTNEKVINKLRETAEILQAGEQRETDLQERVNELETALKVQDESMRTRIASLEKENKLMRAKLESAKGSQSGQTPESDPVHALLEEKITSLEAQLVLAKAELDTESSLEEELEEATKSRDDFASQLYQAQEKLKQYESQSQHQSEAPADMSTTTAELQARVLALKAELNDKTKLSGSNDDLTPQVEKLTSQLEESNLKLSDMTAKYEELSKSLMGAKGESSNLKETNSSALQATLEQTKSELDEVRKELHRAQAELENSQVEVLDENDISDIRNALLESQTRAEKFRLEAESAQLELSNLQEPRSENNAPAEMIALETKFSELQLRFDHVCREAKEDLDAVLLLLENAEIKIAEYEKLLGSLGQDVPPTESEIRPEVESSESLL
ncbi:Intracellular protein transport protein USO1 [Wickerhamiella sorbophila]|uniref:Intracellular protein transport protein USO1 n=1 Tax=Wickerhamiella sorbophila TaxID=45607 RepID=A0A2T0FJ91_9ASCO|nr:Intracellular protein transport protein USO1 [Wickerhamiella sorbophila]PRT55045.1 Intracellular protein transport protein USO1 [Wickerhamiella sorbophila]